MLESFLARLLALLLPAVLAAPAQGALKVVDPAAIVPTVEQQQATRLVTQFVSKYHLRKVPLDDALSAQVLERYLEALDPNRTYFLASDIEAFQALESRVDDLLVQVRLDPLFEVFRVFRSRVEEATGHAVALLDEDFGFAREERYVFDRSEADWPESLEARNDLWRKRIKHDILSLRLAGKPEDEIKDTLRKRYERMSRRVAQLGSADVYQLLMNAYTGAVEPHTSYFSPRTSENFKIHLSLSLEGIGAALRTENEHTVVQRVIPGGPAALSGRLKPEDRITGVAQDDGEMVDVIAWRLEEVVDLIRGPKGTVVTLEVLPKDAAPGDPRKRIRLERNTIRLEEQAAKKRILDTEVGGEPVRVGVIELPSFYLDVDAQGRGDEDYRSTTRDVVRLLGELRDEGIDALVLDLRGNGGGALTEAVKLTGVFIEEGPVVQVRDASGRVKVETDPEPGVAYGGPLAVLVDRYSASASEIFAGAIQDYGRGIVVGEPTYGKGTVQSLVDLDRFVKHGDLALGQLKTTIAQFFRVSGDSTQHRGVLPDLTFPTAFDIEDHGERSLDNALPWARLEEVSHRPGRLSEMDLEALRERHAERLVEDPVFGLLMAEARERKRARDRIDATLVEERRRAEQEARRETRDARTAELRRLLGLPPEEAEGEDEAGGTDAAAAEGEDDAESDVWLREAAQVLADYVALARDPGYRLVREGQQSAAASPSCLLGDC